MVFLYRAGHCVTIEPSIHRHKRNSKNFRQFFLSDFSLQTVLVKLLYEVATIHISYYIIVSHDCQYLSRELVQRAGVFS